MGIHRLSDCVFDLPAAKAIFYNVHRSICEGWNGYLPGLGTLRPRGLLRYLLKVGKLSFQFSLLLLDTLALIIDASTNNRRKHDENRPNNQVGRSAEFGIQDIRYFVPKLVVSFGLSLRARHLFHTVCYLVNCFLDVSMDLFLSSMHNAVITEAWQLLQLANIQRRQCLGAHLLIRGVVNRLHRRDDLALLARPRGAESYETRVVLRVILKVVFQDKADVLPLQVHFYGCVSVIDDLTAILLEKLDASKESILVSVERYKLINGKVDALIVQVHVLKLVSMYLWLNALKVGAHFGHAIIPVAKVVIEKLLILVV